MYLDNNHYLQIVTQHIFTNVYIFVILYLLKGAQWLTGGSLVALMKSRDTRGNISTDYNSQTDTLMAIGILFTTFF